MADNKEEISELVEKRDNRDFIEDETRVFGYESKEKPTG